MPSRGERALSAQGSECAASPDEWCDISYLEYDQTRKPSGMMLPRSALTAALSAGRRQAARGANERDIERCTGHRDLPLCSRHLAPCATRNALGLVTWEAGMLTTSIKPSPPLLPLCGFFFVVVCCRTCPLARRDVRALITTHLPCTNKTSPRGSYMLPLAASSCPMVLCSAYIQPRSFERPFPQQHPA